MKGGYGKAPIEDYSKNTRECISSDESSESEDIEESSGILEVTKKRPSTTLTTLHFLTSSAKNCFSHIIFQDIFKIQNDEKNKLEKKLEQSEQDFSEETRLHSPGNEQRQIW